MIKSAICFAFIFLCGISFVSCSFDDTIAEYTNIHDTKSDNYIPNGPGRLLITYTSDTHIELYWKDNSLGEKGFIIERSESSTNNFIAVDTTLENATTYVDSFDIKLGIKYYYRISAFKSLNKSGYSNTAETMAELNAPSHLLLYTKRKTTNTPGISWTGNCYFENNFIIQSRIQGESSDFKTIGETGSAREWFDLEGLDSNKVYEFRVIAATKRNVSLPSNTITVLYGFIPGLAQQYSSSIEANNVEFSPVNNDFVATCSYYHTSPFTVYNADLQKTNFTLLGPYAGPLKYNPSGNIIALGTAESAQDVTQSRTLFINAHTGALLRAIPVVSRSLDFSSDGSKLAFGAYASPYGHPNLVGVVDMNSYKTLWSLSSYRITKVKMTPDGKRIIAVQDASQSDNIIIFDAADGSVLNVLPSESYAIEDCTISNDGNLLAFSTNGNGISGTSIQIYNLNTLTKVRTINTYARSIAFTHDSKYLAAGYTNVRIFRVSDGRDMGDFGPGIQGNSITSLSFNYMDNMLAGGCQGSVPKIIKWTIGWRSR